MTNRITPIVQRTFDTGCGGTVDTNPAFHRLYAVTATQIIRQIKALPQRERAKVARFVCANHAPNSITRRMIADVEGGRGLIRCKSLSDLVTSLKS